MHVIFSDGTSRGSVSNDADLAETTETLCSQSTCDSYEDRHLVLVSAVTRAHNSSPANSGAAFPQTVNNIANSCSAVLHITVNHASYVMGCL